MWRLRLFLERLGRKRLLIGAGALVALVAAGVAAGVFLATRGGSGKETSSTAPEPEVTNLYYLRALAPKTRVSGCVMNVRFTWRPDYHANQYIGATAVITTAGAGIQGAHHKRFTAKGVSLDVGPISLAGGYQLWSAKVLSIDGDPPGNETTIQVAPPPNVNCG